MAKTKKPTYKPSRPFPLAADALHQESNWLWIPLRKEWRDVTTKPEEIVRQKFIRTLVEHYGYSLEQMDQERRTQHGYKSPRADIVIWQSATEKDTGRTPVLVIECKTDSINIQEGDYYQGESYIRAAGCEFFIATNMRHTAVFKLVPGLPGGFVGINEIPKASDWGEAIRFRPNLDKIAPEFLWRLLQVHAVRSQLEAAARTAVGNFAIGGKDIKALKVPSPLPVLPKDLSQALNNAVIIAKSKRTEANALRSAAWAAFESALFTPTVSSAA